MLVRWLNYTLKFSIPYIPAFTHASRMFDPRLTTFCYNVIVDAHSKKNIIQSDKREKEI